MRCKKDINYLNYIIHIFLYIKQIYKFCCSNDEMLLQESMTLVSICFIVIWSEILIYSDFNSGKAKHSIFSIVSDITYVLIFHNVLVIFCLFYFFSPIIVHHTNWIPTFKTFYSRSSITRFANFPIYYHFPCCSIPIILRILR